MLQWAAQIPCRLKATALQEMMQCNCSKTDTSSCKEISVDNSFNDLSRLSQAGDYLNKQTKKKPHKHVANFILDCIRRGVAADCPHLHCPCEASSGVLHPGLRPSARERHETVCVGPDKGHRND